MLQDGCSDSLTLMLGAKIEFAKANMVRQHHKRKNSQPLLSSQNLKKWALGETPFMECPLELFIPTPTRDDVRPEGVTFCFEDEIGSLGSRWRLSPCREQKIKQTV